MAPSDSRNTRKENGGEAIDTSLSAIKMLLDTGGDAFQYAPIAALDIAAKVLSGFIGQVQVSIPPAGRHCAENFSVACRKPGRTRSHEGS